MSSVQGHDESIIELSCRLGELTISIRGPPVQASELLTYITQRDLPPRGLSSAVTDRSFELVDPPSSSSAPTPAPAAPTTTSTTTRPETPSCLVTSLPVWGNQDQACLEGRPVG